MGAVDDTQDKSQCCILEPYVQSRQLGARAPKKKFDQSAVGMFNSKVKMGGGEMHKVQRAG